MDPERAIQLILDSQAHHAQMMLALEKQREADQKRREQDRRETREQMGELHAEVAALGRVARRHDQAIGKNTEQIASLTDLIGRLAQAELRLVEDLRTLRQVQAATDGRLRATGQQARATDERLRKLIETVDKWIRRNGHAAN